MWQTFVTSQGMSWSTNDIELLGFLPWFLSRDDQRSAREQLDGHYAHGGGWRAFPGFSYDPKTHAIRYPGDPPMRPIGMTMLRNETVLVYPSGWVLILQQSDGTYEIARMD